ncbi:HipA domain-containing protein [bacterium]|nr:HipA domain-containing protein [bacterium]
MKNSVEIYLSERHAGLLERTHDGEYVFTYSEAFLKKAKDPISMTLPLRAEPYTSEVLHPFFDGLVPEGWLLDIALKNWKLRYSDRFELFIATCTDAVGAVSVKHSIENENYLDQISIERKKPAGSLLSEVDCPETKTSICMISYKDLSEDEISAKSLYSKSSARAMFGSGVLPKCVGITSQTLEQIALVQIESGINLTGVQKKMSLGLEPNENRTDNVGKRLTYLKNGGQYILKPQSKDFEQLPETEHLCMKLAEVCKFTVPSCALIPLASGERAFLIKRFDRKNKNKFYQEDFCQLTEKPTSEKYSSSVEKCAKIISKYCGKPTPNLHLFYDIVFFNFLIGNADMHLKNYSLVENKKTKRLELSPCYDFVSTKLVMPEDDEETALTINGKKRKLNRNDWIALSNTMGLPEDHFQNTLKKFKKWLKKFDAVIDKSFISDDFKASLKTIINGNIERIGANKV